MTSGLPLRRRSDGQDVRLDELLDAGAPPLDRRPARPITLVVAAGLLSGAGYWLLVALGLRVPYLLVAAACAGALLVWLAARAVAEPGWVRAGRLTASPSVVRLGEPGGWYLSGDGMVAAVNRWIRRLEWGSGHPARFLSTTVPRIGEVVDERLRQRHGITRASDPDRARELVGEQLWALLGPRDRAPTHHQIMAAIAELEKL